MRAGGVSTRTTRTGGSGASDDWKNIIEAIHVQTWVAKERPSPSEFWRFIGSMPMEAAAESRIGRRGGRFDSKGGTSL